MRLEFGAFLIFAICGTLTAGCAKSPPIVDPPESGDFASNLAELSAPLDVSRFEVVHSGAGYRGFFVKLSRFPDSISWEDSSDPARISLTLRGPTGTESPEEIFPGGDRLVSRVRVTREIGALHVVLDLATDDPPDYTVHRMGDWVMIKMKAPD
jgi:hypothetical protein